MKKEAQIQTIGHEVPNTCTECHGTGLRPCDHVGTGRDADGWCTECECPADAPDKTRCHCQPE